MADETVLDSQTELHNSGVLPRRARPGHGRDTSPPLIYPPRIDVPREQAPVHPQVLAFLTADFSKPLWQRRAASPEAQPGSRQILIPLPNSTSIPKGQSPC